MWGGGKIKKEKSQNPKKNRICTVTVHIDGCGVEFIDI